MKVAVVVLGLLVVAGLAVRWWNGLRARRRWSSYQDIPARREVEAAVALADGLPGRLERVGDPGAVAVALTGGGFPRESVEDLDEDLALLALLADDAARRAAKAELPAALLRRVTGRPLPGEQRLRDAAKRSIDAADAAVSRLEAVAARLQDRHALLDGGRDQVRAVIDRARGDVERTLAGSRVPIDRDASLLVHIRDLAAELEREVERPVVAYADLVRKAQRLGLTAGAVRGLVRRTERQVAEQHAARERALRDQAARERLAAERAARAAAPVDVAAVEAARRAQQAAAQAAAERLPHHA